VKFGISVSQIKEVDLVVQAEQVGYDFCWVWEGTSASLAEMLERADAEIVAEGERTGGRGGGDGVGQSVYTRDPDGNLLEFIRYG